MEKQNDNAKHFFDWLQSLEPYALLDLLMNCGYLLGKTIQPKEVENDGTRTSTENEIREPIADLEK